MENIITLTSGEKIEVLMQDEVSLDIDCSLRYIESGKKEIENYVDEVLKLQLNNIVIDAKEEMKTQISSTIEEAKQQASDVIKGSIDETVDQVTTIVTDYAENKVKPQLNEIAYSVGDSAENAALSSAKAIQSAEDSRIWAEGTESEVAALDGEYSSKGWATQAKQSETNAKNYADSINPSTLVKTSGEQTINGTKTFTSRQIIQSFASDTGGNGFKIQDSNNKGYVALYEYITSDGSHFARLLNNSYGKNAYIDIQTSSAGVSSINLSNADSMKAKTPSATSNDTNIATTAFVNNAGAVVKSKSLADNGYVKFSSGLIIQWGRRTGDTGTVTLPTAFSSATSYSVGTTYNNSSPTDHMYALISDLTSTSFKMVAYNSSSICYWLAIGY